MRRLLCGMMLSGMLMTPVMMQAKDKNEHRVYDPVRKDYHEWNDNEDRAYRHWVEQERHGKYKDWKHASKKEQQEYWRWRHDHADWH